MIDKVSECLTSVHVDAVCAKITQFGFHIRAVEAACQIAVEGCKGECFV